MSNKSQPHSPVSLLQSLKAIWSRAVTDGNSMPGEPTLATELGASRPVVREALIRLEERGYLHRSQGTETAVNRSLVDLQARLDEQIDQSEVIRATGATPAVQVVRQEVVAVTAQESARFGVLLGSPALRTVKVWTADGVPVTTATDTIPFGPDVAPSSSVDASLPVYDLAESLNHIHVTWETVWPSAVLIDQVESLLLSRPHGEPALCLELQGVGVHGQTAYWARELQVQNSFDYALVRHIKRD